MFIHLKKNKNKIITIFLCVLIISISLIKNSEKSFKEKFDGTKYLENFELDREDFNTFFLNHKNLNENKNLESALKKIFIWIKKNKFTCQTILFSPSAASFDSFKNFEDRGNYFNKLVNKYLDGI